MKQTVLFWILAIIITIVAAYYQRVTGPTYPLSGKISIDNKSINFRLDRSHSTESDCIISLETNDNSINGILEWKRYKTDDEWTKVEMKNENGVLSAALPKQPSAGKLQYKIQLIKNQQAYLVPPDQSVVIRYKGDVPLYILIPHVFAMFGAMLLSTRTGLEFFNKEPKLKKLTYWTIGFLIFGGMILGPLVQYFAFGAFWTGFPFGIDLTDNKTLIALIGWIIAAFMLPRAKNPKYWVLGAAVLLFIVYMIPHSVLGSEIDYNKMDQQKNHTEIINFK